MSTNPLLVLAVVPALMMVQGPPAKDNSGSMQMQVTGCVKGSTLTETNLRVSGAQEENPTRRWRLRGPKALMNQIKEHAGKELEIVGKTKTPDSGMVMGGKRIGKTNIYIGGNVSKTARDPVPEQPTLDVESFEPTGETCR
jgi:hypothetical protein